MRKTILTFLGLMLSTGIGMAVSSSEDIITQLFSDNDVSTTLSTDSSELAGLSNGEDPFKNLYLFMYQNVKLAPKEETLKVLVQKSDYAWYSEDDIAAVVAGDIYPLKEALGSGVTQSILIETYAQIQNDYNNELQLQIDNRGLIYEALAKEIFYNNDLTDSASVDILYDLDLINFLLFNEYVPETDRSGDPAVVPASEETILASEETVEKPKLAKVKRSTDTSTVAVSSAVTDIICSIDTELSDAITAYEEANPEPVVEEVDEPTVVEEDEDAPELDEPEADADVPDSEPEADDSDEGEDDSGEDAEEAPAEATVDEFVASLGGAVGNWDRELPCDEIFCITVELIPGETEDDDNSYEKTDDCIACHISYIKQKLEETLSKPVAPSKVPMNNFEDGTCKEAGNKINLDINVYAIKKPIFTPENDSTPDASAKAVEDLKQVLYSTNALTTPEGVTGTTQSQIETARILNTRAGLDQADVAKQIIAADEARRAAVKKTLDDFEFKARGQASQDFEDQILGELATFKSYFSQFSESLKSTLAPLESLAGKKYCE